MTARYAIPALLALGLAGCEAGYDLPGNGRIFVDPDLAWQSGVVAPPDGEACVALDDERRPRLTSREACAGQPTGLVRRE